MGGVITVQVDDASSLSAHGHTESGEWWATCDEDATHCSVKQLRARAGFLENRTADERRLERMLFFKQAFQNSCAPHGNEVGSQGCVYWNDFGRFDNWNECGTGWCYGNCCYHNKNSMIQAVANFEYPPVIHGDSQTSHFGCNGC